MGKARWARALAYAQGGAALDQPVRHHGFIVQPAIPKSMAENQTIQETKQKPAPEP